MVMVLHNENLTLAERQRAEDARVIIIDTQDLAYFEQLTDHIGPAARYQFLADVMMGRQVPGLHLTVPAIRAKMGGNTAYTFSISPDYLLKVGYVSHRAKGKASDVDTYQRMISKGRLKSSRKYIHEELNVFPTNIVVSLDGKQRFDLSKKMDNSVDDLGWLHISPNYKAAWIIDGQHRLFAYSGSSRAKSSRLSVLAFEKLSPSLQAQMFIDININAEQKAVKKDLLHELYSELHWNSDDTAARTKAVITKSVQTLDKDLESPFYDRVIAAEGVRSFTRCLSLTNMFKALHQPELYMGYARGGRVEKPGILWASDNDSMLRRTCTVLNGWFTAIEEMNREWWALGSAPGGGLAMNDSVFANIMVMRSVAEHLAKSGKDLYNFDDDEAVRELLKYAQVIAAYLSGLDENDRAGYRDLRGVQGQTTRMRHFQREIRNAIPNFCPLGLDKFIEEESAQTNSKAREIVECLETFLQKNIIAELKREFGDEGNEWWTSGVPRPVRVSAAKLQEEDDNSRGAIEYYLNLIDYRKIIQDNWILLEPLFGLGSKNSSKEKRTAWLQSLNEVRKIVAHASSGMKVSLEQLDQIRDFQDEILNRVNSLETT
jgi:DGQHR domain-containing protein